MTTVENDSRGPDAAALLREGIAAAKAGNREQARELLTSVVKMDDHSVVAWLWLSGVVDDLNHREVCLQTAARLAPDNEAVQRGLALVRRQKVEELLRAGLAAAERGQRDHARALLLRVVEADEKNLAAWLALADMVTTVEDRETALENALSLAPGDETIRRRLEQAREQMALEQETRAAMAPHFAEEPAREGPASSPATVVVDWEHPTRADEFDDELLCPYCATRTQFDDRRCRACGSSLVIKTRVREERSSYLWIAITLQLAQVCSNLLGLFGALAALGMLLQQNGLSSAPPVLAALQFLLRPPAEAPAVLGGNVLGLRLLLLAVVATALTSTVVLVGLFMRWRVFWYLFLVNAGLGLVTAVAAMFVASSVMPVGIVCGGVMVLLQIGMVFLAFQMQDDFFFNYSRILLRPDRSARSALDYLAHARQYANRQMWALAVVHYQRAAGIMAGQIEPHLGLAVSLAKVKHHDRAAAALAEARRIAPDNPHIAEVEAMLREARSPRA